MDYSVANKKWSEERLWEMRNEILSWWRTGEEIRDISVLKESVKFQKSLPKGKVYFSRVLQARKNHEIPLVELPVGHATTEDTSQHIKAMAEAGCDLAFIFTDTYTRKARYAESQKALDESKRLGKSVINGYAIVNEGYRKARTIIEENSIPCGLWDGPDELPMLQFDIGLAAGFTTHGAMDLHDLYQHSKDYPLDKRIVNNQYGCRLAAWYEEQGAIIGMYMPGNLTGYEPPDIKMALMVLQALGTAEQGCKHLSCYLNGVMSLTQDVAALRVYRKLIREYLDRFGHKDVEFITHYGSYQGNWPMNRHRGAAIVAWSAAIAALGGCDVAYLRSVAEGFGAATPEDGVATAKVGKQITCMLRYQRLPDSEELKTEEHMTEISVRAIVDKVLEMGEGDPLKGKLEAVKVGVLDDSFSGWKGTYGKVLPIRDVEGAVRWYESGNLPLPKEVIEYHKRKLEAREKKLGKKLDLNVLTQDLFCASADDWSKVSLG